MKATAQHFEVLLFLGIPQKRNKIKQNKLNSVFYSVLRLDVGRLDSKTVKRSSLSSGALIESCELLYTSERFSPCMFFTSSCSIFLISAHRVLLLHVIV